MTISKSILTALAVAAMLPAWGQDTFDLQSQRKEVQNYLAVPGKKLDHKGIIINPTPQSIEVSNAGTVNFADGFKLKGDDRYQADLLKASIPTSWQGTPLTIVTGAKAAKKQGVEAKEGAYKLTVDKRGVTITGYDDKGAFYGIQTLRQLVESPIAASHTLPYLTVTDFPDLPHRGVVEGFYGTPCRMKLPVWNEVINSFKAIPGRDVSFVMILQSPDTAETGYTLRRDNFMHPVEMDRAGSFAAVNSLPSDEATHTLLLDSDGRVAAIGNPALNPKIRELYRRIISGSDEAPAKADKLLCQNPVVAVGAVDAGDTVTKRFALYNPGTSPLTLQELVGSCDCTVATASTDTIAAGGSAMITVSIAANTLPGPFLHWVDIYYNERDCPERLTLHGYVK